MPAPAPAVAHVGGGDGRQLAVGEHGALGRAGGARGEDHRDQPVGIVRIAERAGRATGVAPPQVGEDVLRLLGPHHREDPSGVCLAVGPGTEVVGGQHRGRAGHRQHRVALGRGVAGVDAGRDRPQLGQRRVGDHVVGRGRQQQADQVALADPGRGEADGRLVGQAVQVGVGERPPARAVGRVGPTGRHEGGGVAEPAGGLGHRGGERHGVHSTTRAPPLPELWSLSVTPRRKGSRARREGEGQSTPRTRVPLEQNQPPVPLATASLASGTWRSAGMGSPFSVRPFPSA